MVGDDGLRAIDIHLGRFLAVRSGFAGAEQERFARFIERLSSALENGHSCLELAAHEREFLSASRLVSAGEMTPLVLYGNRLYLHRYYRYEERLAHNLIRLAAKRHSWPGLDDLLERSFGTDKEDLQRAAARLALERSLCLVSGGPGTGKTTTVVRILAILLELLGSQIRIALAAPTGKAAMRLQESVGDSIARLEANNEVRERIPTTAMTLHRLLGVVRNAPRFRHNRENPLPWDVLVIDEASMVDLALMSKTIDALKPGCHLILLGDKDQLASVESGAVLADCIEGMPGNTVELRKTWRFNAAIKELATQINRRQGQRCWELLTDGACDEVGLLGGGYEEYIGERFNAYQDIAGTYPETGGKEIFDAFRRFQVLCATRSGPRGVEAVNRMVERALACGGHDLRGREWYHGRPVMVTRNDYSMELYNGDVGICLLDPGDNQPRVWFEQPGGDLRSCPPHRLPAVETVYAMTIHKSQGSEFTEVLVMLPEQMNRVLNKQLVYTAVTRARERVRLVAERDILVSTVGSDYLRSSGLARMLQERMAPAAD